LDTDDWRIHGQPWGTGRETSASDKASAQQEDGQEVSGIDLVEGDEIVMSTDLVVQIAIR
jgi:hypothetical protein